MKFSWSLIQQRLGGRWPLSWRLFAIGTPALVLGFVLNEPAAYLSVSNAGKVLLLALIGQATTGLFFLAGTLARGGSKRKSLIPLWFLLPLWGVAALARLAVLLAGIRYLGFENPLPLSIRVASSLVIIIAGFGVATYALDALDEFRQKRAEALAHLLMDESQLSAHRTTVQGMQDALIAQIDDEITESHDSAMKALDDLDSSLEEPSLGPPNLDELRKLSDTTWRNISGKIWQGTPPEPPRIRTKEFATIYLKSSPFNIWFLFVSAVVLFVLVYIRSYGVLESSILVALWFVVTLTMAWLVDQISARTSLSREWVMAPAVVLYSLSGFTLVVAGSLLAFTPTNPVAVIIVHSLTVLVTLVITMPTSMSLAQDEVLSNLKKNLNDSTIEKLHVESQLAIVSQKIANRLHGDVRGNFLAATLSLQQHLDAGDIEKARTVISKLRAVLADGSAALPASGSSRTELEEFIGNWSALVDIHIERPLSELPPAYEEAAHVIIVDAINDAVRHGKADWIRISYVLERAAVVFTISNNGLSLAKGQSGLGTAHLNDLAPENWHKFTNDEGITQLIVRLNESRVASVPHRA